MVTLRNIRLYQPDPILQERVGHDARPISDYVNALVAEANAFWDEPGAATAKGVLVGVGLRPGGLRRIWCEAVECDIPAARLDAFRSVLKRCPPPDVKNGPVALAMELALFDRTPSRFPMTLQAWTDACTLAGRSLVVPDGIFGVIWPA